MSKELQDALRQLGKRSVDTFAGKVVSIDKEQGTCKVEYDGIEYTDVRLSAVIDGSNKRFYVFPKKRSYVLVSPINEDINNLYVEQYSELESTDLRIDAVRFQIDKNGFLLQKENETLKKLMHDLLQEIMKMKFTTNTGPTILLINKPQFELINNRFNQFLKDN